MNEKKDKDEENLAPVNPSGDKLGEKITLQEVLPHLQQDYFLKKPFIFLVGGLVTNGETTGDIDILIRLPDEIGMEIKVPLEFRIYRALPQNLRERVSILYDKWGGPFTNFIEIADLKVEAREEPKRVFMSLDLSDNEIEEYLNSVEVEDSTETEEIAQSGVPPRRGFGQKQTYNSPTFAYLAVYGKEPDEFLSGQTDHPNRIWKGMEVDEHLRDSWLEALNSIEGTEIRASCEGHSSERVSYVVFRLKDEDKAKAKRVSKTLAGTEACYSLADIGDEGKMRIVVAGKVWYGEKEWESWWENLAPRIRCAVEKEETKKDADVERLELGQFRAEGIDEDLKNPVKRFRELLAGLRYLANAGYPLLKEGKKWGEWKLEDILKYFAKIVDVLRRETKLPLLDTENDGTKKDSSSWWKCYRDAEKFMNTKPPTHEEAKEWNRKRRFLFEKPGEKRKDLEEIREALDVEFFPEAFLERAEQYLFEEITRAEFRAVGAEGAAANKEAKQSQKEDKVMLFRRLYPLKSSLSGLHAYRKGEVYSVQSAIDHLQKLYARGVQ